MARDTDKTESKRYGSIYKAFTDDAFDWHGSN